MADEWTLVEDDWTPVEDTQKKEPGFWSRAGTRFVDSLQGIGSLVAGVGNYIGDSIDHGPYDALVERLPSANLSTLTSGLDIAGRTGATIAGAEAGVPFAPFTLGLSVPFGAAVGNLGYDALNYFTGNTSKAPDLANLPADTLLNSAFTPLVSKSASATGGLLTRSADYIDDVYDPKKALNSAFSTRRQDFIPSAGSMPLDEAISNLTERGIISPQSMASSRTPFTDLYKQLYSTSDDLAPGNSSILNVVGKQVDETVSRIPGEIPYSKLDPRKILPSDEIAAPTANINRSIAEGQFLRDLELDLRKRGVSEYDIASELDKARQGIRTPDPTSALLRGAPLEDTSLSAPEAINRARAFGDPANWDNISTSPRADKFRTLDTATRNEVRNLAAAESPELAQEFGDINRQYQSLSTLRDPVEARMAGEKLAPQPWTTRVYTSLTAPLRGLHAVTVGDPARSSTYNNPSRLLNIAAGQSLGQRTGFSTVAPMVMRGAGNALTTIGENPSLTLGASEALGQGNPINGPGFATSPMMRGAPNISLATPAMASDGRPQGVQTSLVQSYQPEEEPGNIPRHINAVDPRMIGSMLSQYVPQQDMQPLAIQAMKIFASKDKKEIARFLGALSEKYPDMPFEKGAVTGLPSEWQMEDGSTKLFSDLDVQKWANEIETSPIREDEKAQRLRALYTDGTVYPIDKKLNDFGAPIMVDDSFESNEDPQTLALKNLMNSGSFTPRRMTSFGSAKIGF